MKSMYVYTPERNKREEEVNEDVLMEFFNVKRDATSTDYFVFRYITYLACLCTSGLLQCTKWYIWCTYVVVFIENYRESMQICGLDNTLRKPCSLKLHCTKCRTFFFQNLFYSTEQKEFWFSTQEKSWQLISCVTERITNKGKQPRKRIREQEANMCQIRSSFCGANGCPTRNRVCWKWNTMMILEVDSKTLIQTDE